MSHSDLFVSWQPGNYQRTVKRTEDAFQACNDIVACFQERARVERQYAQQLSEWSNKWKPVVDSSEFSNCTLNKHLWCGHWFHLNFKLLKILSSSSSSSSSSFSSSLRLSSEGLAVFSVLCRSAGQLTRLRLPLAGVGGREPGQNVAEGLLPQEVIWRLQGVSGHRHRLRTCSEAMGQKTKKGQSL